MPPRIAVPRFVGGSNRLITGQASAEATINQFPETTKGGGKVERYLRPSEGIQAHASFASTDASELFAQDGRAYACVGTIFGEFLSDGSSIVRGAIAYDGTPASLCSNGSAGNQVGITSAGHVYMYNTLTDAFAEVDFGGRTIVMLEFMDGYFLAQLANSRTVFYSTLENGLVWDFTFGKFERSWGSDNISFIKRSGRQLWVVGTKTTEVWVDTGNATTPFQPVQGVFPDIGCIASFTGKRFGDSLGWLSQDEHGGGLVVRANGYQAEAVSTYAIDVKTQNPLVNLATAEALAHQFQGHEFYWLQVPGLTTTPVLDATENEWSERAIWVPETASYVRHIARCHCYAFEKHFIGVRESGIIYELSPDYLTDGIV